MVAIYNQFYRDAIISGGDERAEKRRRDEIATHVQRAKNKKYQNGKRTNQVLITRILHHRQQQQQLFQGRTKPTAPKNLIKSCKEYELTSGEGEVEMKNNCRRGRVVRADAERDFCANTSLIFHRRLLVCGLPKLRSRPTTIISAQACTLPCTERKICVYVPLIYDVHRVNRARIRMQISRGNNTNKNGASCLKLRNNKRRECESCENKVCSSRVASN